MQYRMPAEWERHEGTWLSWPKDETTFPGKILENARWTYVEMIEALSRGEKVHLLVDDDETKDEVSSMVNGSVTFETIPTVDVWVRDYGPIFVKNQLGKIAATKWNFNAWGNKYEDLKKDDESGTKIALSTGLEVLQTGVVLEGGSIDVNGRGTLITTRQCLLNKNRNPSLNQKEIESTLEKFLGVEKIVWLEGGVEGDDTDGHVDDVARFVSEDAIVAMMEEEKGSNNNAILKKDVEILNESGLYNITTLQMPRKLAGPDGIRLPASYANFYIGNSAVLVPTFGDDPSDENALETMRNLFPGRKILGIDCRALVWGLGSMHCVTQQQPA